MAQDDGKDKWRDLADRVDKLRDAAGLAKPEQEQRPGRHGYGAGIQVGIELVAGIFGGALIGYLLDRWLGTWPVLFLVLFFLGAAAGMLNAYRYIQRASNISDK